MEDLIRNLLDRPEGMKITYGNKVEYVVQWDKEARVYQHYYTDGRRSQWSDRDIPSMILRLGLDRDPPAPWKVE